MPLTFQNSSGQEAYLALLLYDSGCGPNNQWRKLGWYAIANGGSFTVTSDDLRNMNGVMAWYADWWAGGPSWSGTGNQWYWVTNNAFDQCYDDNTNCDVQYDFQDLYFNGNYGILVTLGAPGQANQPGQYTVTPISPPPPPPHSDHGDGWGFGDGFSDGFDDGFSDGFDDGFSDAEC